MSSERVCQSRPKASAGKRTPRSITVLVVVVVDVAVGMSAVALRRKTGGDLGEPACEIWF
jgi:hypothetical protein